MLAERPLNALRPARARPRRAARRRSARSVALRAPPDLIDRNRDAGHLPAVQHRQLRRHLAVDARSEQEDCQRLQRVRERVLDRRALVAAMRHAVVALRIAARAVLLPVRRLHQLLERRRVPFVDEEIAGLLPAEDVVRGIRPRRALIALIPGEEIEEQARLIEAPLARAGPSAVDELAEELLRLPSPEEHVLARRMIVAVARTGHHAFNAEAHHLLEETGDVVRILDRVQRAVSRHAEAALLREL